MKISQMMMSTLIELTLSLRLPIHRFQHRSSVQAGEMFNPFLLIIHKLAAFISHHDAHKLCKFFHKFSWYWCDTYD